MALRVISERKMAKFEDNLNRYSRHRSFSRGFQMHDKQPIEPVTQPAIVCFEKQLVIKELL